MKRIFASITVLVVMIGFILTACSAPGLQTKDQRGFEHHKESYMIMYEATPQDGGAPVFKESPMLTVERLEERIDKLGLSQPEIIVLEINRNRIRLADVTDEDEVRRRGV